MNGQCVDVPSEPAESGYANKIKVTSYPVIEQGGVIWTYMGKAENMPPKPNYEFSIVPKEQSFTSKRLQECNWLSGAGGRHRLLARLMAASRRREGRSASRTQAATSTTSTISHLFSR